MWKWKHICIYTTHMYIYTHTEWAQTGNDWLKSFKIRGEKKNKIKSVHPLMENSHRIEMLQKKNKKLKMYTTDQELVNYIQPVGQSQHIACFCKSFTGT